MATTVAPRRGLVIALILVIGIVLAWLARDHLHIGVAGPGDALRAVSIPAPNTSTISYPPAFPSFALRPPGQHEVDLCGVGPVSTEADGPLAAAEGEAWAVLLSSARRLQQADGEAARSLGLALEVRVRGMQVWRHAASERPTCLNDAPCAAQVEKQRARAVLPAVEAIVALAVATRDPQVYATAIHNCFGTLFDRPESCKRIDFAGWTRLEPANGVPWLGAAAEARQRGDLAGVEEAMQRVAAAKTISSRYIPAADVIAELPKTTEATRALMLGELATFYGPTAIGGYGDLLDYCRQQNLHSPSRMEVCRSIRGLLLEKGETLLDFAVGIGLAEQTGMPNEQVTALREEFKQLRAAMSVQGQNLLSCGWLARAERWIPQIWRKGELKYARSLAPTK